MKSTATSVLSLMLGLSAAMSLSGATIFSGNDNGVGPADARPSSDTARNSFVAATGAGAPITFEGLAVGFSANFTAAPGVDVTLTGLTSGFCGGVCATDEHSLTPLGYNTTTGGSQHLRVVPNFDSPAGGTVTFSFANPIDGFGFYLTDTQDNFPGPITVTFTDGVAQTLSVIKNDSTGGALFWGYSSPGAAISSFSLNTGATGDIRDLWGIDDVYYSSSEVPEPGTWLLLGTGMALLYWRRSR